MKLTRTDVVFSKAACMVFLCAGIWIFRYLRKCPEKIQKIHAPRGTQDKKVGQRGARGAPGALLAPPGHAGRPPGWVPPPLVTYLGPYFNLSRGNPRTEVVFPILVA